MSTQVYFPQATFPQDFFTPEILDFSFMDSQPAVSDILSAGLPNNPGFPDTSNIELDEQLVNLGSSLTPEQIQQMIDSFSAPFAALPQEIQSIPVEASHFQQEINMQNYESVINDLPQPSMIVPSQASVASVASQSAAPAPEQPRSASVDSTPKTSRKTMLIKAITLLKLNIRFNPLFQNMGIVSCPDKIDLKAGMEREDAMIAAGYLPRSHIPWEQALKLLGKQGFRTYYYGEMKNARENNVMLPPVPEWIIRHCFAKGVVNKFAGVSKKSSGENTLKNKQAVAKALLARNNPTRRSKAATALHKNKGKGKAVDTQRYNPYARQ